MRLVSSFVQVFSVDFVVSDVVVVFSSVFLIVGLLDNMRALLTLAHFIWAHDTS